ncbi:hypothetical protein ES703_62847 [subsurface metagenome]
MEIPEKLFLKGNTAVGLVKAAFQDRIEPGSVYPHRALGDTPGTAGTQFREAGLLQRARARFPRTADTAGIGLPTEGVAAYGLEVSTDVKAGAAPDAV